MKDFAKKAFGYVAGVSREARELLTINPFNDPFGYEGSLMPLVYLFGAAGIGCVIAGEPGVSLLPFGLSVSGLAVGASALYESKSCQNKHAASPKPE